MSYTQVFRVLFKSWISKKRSGSMIKKISIFFGFSGLALVLVLANSGLALAAELFVDDDGVDCPDADFTTIQAAVDAADPRDTIRICTGIYDEQINISKPLVIIGSNGAI